MTPKEMHLSFNNQLHTFDDKSIRGQVDADLVEDWLNQAQDQYITRAYNEKEDQQVRDILSPIIVKDNQIDATYGGSTSGIKNIYLDQVDTPNDFRYYLNSRSEVLVNHDGITWNVQSSSRVPSNSYDTYIVSNKEYEIDDIYLLLQDPFRGPSYQEPVVDFSETHINVYTNDKFIVDSVILNYIRDPATISIKNDVSCELHNFTHRDIVREAVRLFLSNLNNNDN